MSEFDGEQSVVTQCHITRIWKNGYSPMRNEFAFVNLRIGECQIGATLLLDGSLKLPGDVRIPADLQQRVKREAQHLALQELAAEWRMQRDVGADGRYIDPGEP
jgi:hypothetical protein